MDRWLDNAWPNRDDAVQLSLAAVKLASPILAGALDQEGGIYLASGDGGIFALGDIPFLGLLA